MRTQDFITACANGKREKAGNCASVYFDGKHIYSYGRHYPLLIRVKDKWLLNDKGYSATTGKHISYASEHADYHCPVASTNPIELLAGLMDVIHYKHEELKKLSKRAWKQKQIIEERIKDLNKTVDYLKLSA